MPSIINEHTQFIDPNTSLPAVGGSLYIGAQNQDPVANPITIYSDRGLTTTLANPQTLDSSGRSTNKIFVPGKYSEQVNNSAAVQIYQNLDCGELAQTGISLLDNVQGTNTITAEGSPSILTLVDKQLYSFTAANANTGAVTLKIDTTAAKTVKKSHDQDLAADDIKEGQVVYVADNAADDVFEMISSANSGEFSTVGVNGVAFPATQVPSADANTLDDYEEGIFTPTVGDDSLSEEGQTYTTQNGIYTKVGRMVYFSLEIETLSVAALTGGNRINVMLGTLPNAAATYPHAVSVGDGTQFTGTASTAFTGYIPAGTNYIAMRHWDSTTGANDFTVSEWSDDGRAVISGFYFV